MANDLKKIIGDMPDPISDIPGALEGLGKGIDMIVAWIKNRLKK